jgi:toxin ParE1/3/4
MRVEYSKRAVSDLHQIAEYHIRAGEARLAEAVGDAIRHVVARLAQLPGSGRALQQRPGVRVVFLLRYRYKIFYRTSGAAVRILHIRHTSRRPWPDS